MQENTELSKIGTNEQPFGPSEEKAIISLAFDMPEWFSQFGKYLSYKYFKKIEHQFTYAIIETFFKKHGCIPTRDLALDTASRKLTVDDDWEPIIEAINRKSDPRETPAIKELLLDWARNKAYGMLYSPEAHEAWLHKDYETLDEFFDEAKKITDVTSTGYWFFDQIPMLFEESTDEKLTTGFPMLDSYINEGGPTRGDVFVWMAPTGVGKTIMLVHAGKMSLARDLNVLHVTLEISDNKTAQRYMGAFTEEKIATRIQNKDKIESKLYKLKNSTKGNLAIYYFPPEEITVDDIHHLIETLKRTKGWTPDVVIVDYLELMISRNSYNNKEEYIRQKKTATELRGLAKKQNVLVFTATQTNRSNGSEKGNKKDGNADGGVIDVNRVSESYGKMMPTDYVVSINQSQEEYNRDIPLLRFYIAKNRNGPKFKTVRARINYNTMSVKQEDFL